MLRYLVLVHGHRLQQVVLRAMEHNHHQCDSVLHGLHGADFQGLHEQALITEPPFNLYSQDNVHCRNNHIVPFAVLLDYSYGVFQWGRY